MNKELIEVLSDVTHPDYPKALGLAIDLARAAEPKDEAAEREHCIQACEEHFGHSLGLWPNGPDLLVRERAAVRAPLQAEIERQEKLRTESEICLRAENERLKRQLKVANEAPQVERRLADEYAAKLTNLRRAAERYRYQVENDLARAVSEGALRDAIEAAKIYEAESP